MLVQGPARTRYQGGVKGGRSHGGELADETLGTSDGEGAAGGGDPGRAEQTKSQVEGLGGGGDLEDHSGTRATEVEGGAGQSDEAADGR